MKSLVALSVLCFANVAFAEEISLECKSINEIFNEGAHAPKPNVRAIYKVVLKDEDQAEVSKVVLPNPKATYTLLTRTRFNPTVFAEGGYAFKMLSSERGVLRSVEPRLDLICTKAE